MHASHRRAAVFSAVLLGVAAWNAWAHKPLYAEEKPNHFSKAIEVAKPSISQVYYSELDPQAPYTWLVFDAKPGDQIYFSLGIPDIERLESFRPRVALIGPGLPPLDTQFPSPSAYGEVFAPVGDPEFFHERVTGTDSYILLERTVTIPEAGRYYLVAFAGEPLPDGPKLWVSIGTRERFTLRDLFRLGRIKREVRVFHEVGAR